MAPLHDGNPRDRRREFLYAACLGFRVPSLLKAFATERTNLLRGAKAGIMWGCGEGGDIA